MSLFSYFVYLVGIVPNLYSASSFNMSSLSYYFDKVDPTLLSWVFPSIGILLSASIIFYNKASNKTSTKEEETKSEESRESDYEEKYKEYIDKLNEEIRYTDQRYKKLYSRIMKIMTYKTNNYPKDNKLYGLLSKFHRLFSRSRISLSKKPKRLHPDIVEYINFTTKWMYKNFRRRTVFPVHKGDKKVDRNKLKEISVPAFKVHKRNVPFNHIWPVINTIFYDPRKDGIKALTEFQFLQPYRKEYLFDVQSANYRDVYKQSSIYNLRFGLKNRYHKYTPPFYNKIIKKMVEHFPALGFLTKLFNYPTLATNLNPSVLKEQYKGPLIWKSISHYMYTWAFPHSDKYQFTVRKKDRTNGFSNWPWFHQLHTIYTKNRLYYFKERYSKQRVKRPLVDKFGPKKVLRSKIRYRNKYNRNSSNIWLNYYYYRKKNLQNLHKSLKMLYSKHPIYKTSTRHMSNQYLNLLKQSQERIHKRLLKNKDNKLHETIAFFNGLTAQRLASKKKGKVKITIRRFIYTQTFRINKLRENLLWKPDEARDKVVIPRIVKWLVDKSSFIPLSTSIAKLDLLMASFALKNPTEFKNIFKSDLNLLKTERPGYLKFLLRDSYSIQRIGSTFFFYLGYNNPISIKRLPIKDQIYNWWLERQLLGGDKPNPDSIAKDKKVYTVTTKKHTYKLKKDYRVIKRYNAYNYLNSLLKSILLSSMKKFDTSSKNKPSSNKPLFQFLYKNQGQGHLKALYGFLFKSEYERVYNEVSDRSVRHKHKRTLNPRRHKSISELLYNRLNNLRRPGKKSRYDVFKRYLKLKARGELPKGVRNLVDWYKFIESWEWSLKLNKSTSSRYVYVPFHLIAFNLRTHLYPRFIRRGLKPFRYNEKIRVTKYVRNFWKNHVKFLDPKRKSISRLSRTSVQLNQTRYSLLNNQYLFMRELLEKHIKKPTVDYYKYLARTFTSPFINYFLGTPKRLMFMYNLYSTKITSKIESSTSKYVTFFFTNQTYVEMCDSLLQSIIQSFNFIPFYETLLSTIITIIKRTIKDVVDQIAIFIVATIFGFNVTVKLVREVVWYARLYREVIWFVRGVDVWSIRPPQLSRLGIADQICMILIENSIFKAILRTLQMTLSHLCINTLIICKSFFFMVQELVTTSRQALILSIASILNTLICFTTKDFISFVYLTYTTIRYNLCLLSNFHVQLFYIVDRIILFFYNGLFIQYLLLSFRWIHPGEMSMEEHRILSALFIAINKFKPKGWRFVLQYRNLLLKDDYFIYIHHIFTEYYARWMHFLFRDRRIFKHTYKMCLSFITNWFFGSWFINGYTYRFRWLWFAYWDELILRTFFFAGAHVLMSPLYISYAIYLFFSIDNRLRRRYGFDFLINAIHRQIVLVCGFLFGYPTYYFYNNYIYGVKHVSELFVTYALAIYNIILMLVIYSHTFLNVLFATKPFLLQVVHGISFGFWPYRSIGGYRYAITSEQEIFTATSIFAIIIMAFYFMYTFWVEFYESVFALIRIIRLKTRKPSNPFKWIDLNYDLHYPNYLGGIKGMYLRYIYRTTLRVNYDYYNNRGIIWLFFTKPVQALIHFRHIGKALLSDHRDRAATHLRKYCNMLYRNATSNLKIPLQTGWTKSIFPTVNKVRYSSLMNKNLPVDKELFYWDWDDVLTLAPRIIVRDPIKLPPEIVLPVDDPIYKTYLKKRVGSGSANTRESYDYIYKILPEKLKKAFRPYNKLQDPIYRIIKRVNKLHFYIKTLPSIYLFFLESYIRLLIYSFSMFISVFQLFYHVVIPPEIPILICRLFKKLDTFFEFFPLLKLIEKNYLEGVTYEQLDRGYTHSYQRVGELIYNIWIAILIDLPANIWHFIGKLVRALFHTIVDLIQFPYICYYDFIDYINTLWSSPRYLFKSKNLKELKENYILYCQKLRAKPSTGFVLILLPIVLIPFKIIYRIFMFRVYKSGYYPYLDNERIFIREVFMINKLHKSSPTHGPYYIRFDRNKKKKQDFEKNKRYSYDYFTNADDLRGQ